MKFLSVITGETYRNGGGQTKTRGGGNAYKNQMLACESQLNLLHNIVKKNNIECDIFFNLYKFNEKFDNEIVNMYSKFPLTGNFNSHPFGEENLIHQTIDLLNQNRSKVEQYLFIFLFRTDHFLKKYFNVVFDVHQKNILFSFPSIPGIPNVKNINELLRDDKVWVDHQIMFIPQKYIPNFLDYKIWNRHESYTYAINNGIIENDLWFFIDTYHSSSTDMTWNPLYHQVGRNEIKTWEDRGYFLDKKTRRPIYKSEDSSYIQLIDNDFTENC